MFNKAIRTEESVVTAIVGDRRRKRGESSRQWNHSAVDLKHALASACLASTYFLEAHELAETDTRQSEHRLGYALDQAALARDLLGTLLDRYGRDLERPLVAEDALAPTPVPIRPKQRTNRSWYDNMKAAKRCVICGEPAATDRVLCQHHIDLRTAAQVKRRRDEANQIAAVGKKRSAVGAK